MNPETRCAFNAVMSAHWSSATESITECEAAFLGGMLEAARLCRHKVRRDAGYDGRWEGYGGFDDDMTGKECAALIESSVKGE